MNNKILKKLILVVVLTLTVAATWLYANPRDIATDSGFDASYDSGGGWSSGGSDYSSGSDFGSSHDHSSSRDRNRSSSSGGLTDTIMFLVLYTLAIVCTYYATIKAARKEKLVDEKKIEKMKNELKAREDSINTMLQKYVKEESKKEFISNRYQDYVDIQNAWMNFDYDTLKAKTTNELYNQYQMQLETLKVKGQKNVMRDFKYIDGKILNIVESNNKVIVTVEIVTKFYDYIIEESTNEVVRGNARKTITIFYRMKFVRDINIDEIIHCPNCGAELRKTSTNVCEFCKTIITKESEEWLLAEKECLSQL